MNSRPATPAPVRRQLRQEARFGCCECGGPIFQFHHIVPYADDPHFRPEDMMVLCPNCHDKAGSGVWTVDEQRSMKADPYNARHGHAKGQLVIKQNHLAVDIGGHVFDSPKGDLIRVGGEPLLATALADGRGPLLLSAKLYAQDDSLLAEIAENEWISHEPMPWDIEFEYQEISIRSAPRKIDLRLDARSDPVSLRGELWRKGRQVRVDGKGIHVDDAHFIGGGRVEGAVIELDAGDAGMTGFRLVPATRHVRPHSGVGRNDPCPCGSGHKFKRCHGA